MGNKNRRTVFWLLFCKEWNRQKFSASVIFLLLFLASLSMFTAVTVFHSGTDTVEREMERLGFGDLTVWTTDQPDTLLEEIQRTAQPETVTKQDIIYAGYEVNGFYSDNEGQLLVYDGTVPYRFIERNGTDRELPVIGQGEIYISPALEAMFDVKPGDTVTFELSRADTAAGSRKRAFTVEGYFEDAFMGSSMIDMKSFLVCESDYREMFAVLEAAGEENALGERGAMFHITQKTDRRGENAYQSLAECVDIARFIRFSYRRESIAGYMLLLQNILAGFLLIFSAVLLIVCLIMIRHSISLIIEQEQGDMAVLKTLGLSGTFLLGIYLVLYGAGSVLALGLGLAFCVPAARLISQGMITSTGMAVGISLPFRTVTLIFAAVFLLLLGYVFRKTLCIRNIAPMETIRETHRAKRSRSALHKKRLVLHLAVRNVLADKRKYSSLLLISLLLTVFLCVIGRMGTWLGADGTGLMNAFSVADHDIGVQPFYNSVPMDEIERAINWYSPVIAKYELAMESVVVNGREYTANVLNDTKWFHLLSGSVCDGGSILVTDTVANELGVAIGDTVRVSAKGRTEEYRISGIYQCANGMGSNIGMSMDGYSHIGDITRFIWCYHYILEDGSMRDYAYEYLQEHYTGIDVHTNSWSGLDGIVAVLHLLIGAFYAAAGIVILLSVSLVSEKLLQSETFDMAVYQSLGFHTKQLRISFTLRFFIVVFTGCVAGLVVAGLFADSLIEAVFRSFGIGEFAAAFGMLGTFVPFVVILGLFTIAAWIFSAKISKVSIIELIAQSNE